MGFFDDLVGKTKNAAHLVGKNAGNLVDSSKLKIHASEIKGDIQKSYEALGKLVYEANKNGTDAAEATSQAVAAIDELYEQVAAIEAQLLKLSNKVICSQCGEKSENTSMFCPKCGAKLEQEEPAAPEGGCGCGCDGAGSLDTNV